MNSKPNTFFFKQAKSSKSSLHSLVHKLCWLLAVLVLLLSCSTKKDRFLNRNWHALNSKYNVLFNGEMAFDQAWTQLQNGYEENFWEPLPIERFVLKENGSTNTPANAESPFSLAEEKAVKAIKTHGMTLKGEEKNPQMVAAYSLLGRARYFDQRFVPALEAFNYIIRRYPASNKLNEVRIWKEKTNLRLGNEEVALENIKRLLKYRKLKGADLSNAYAVRAQSYKALGHMDSCRWDLKRAFIHSKKPLQKARYGYILGQLFQSQQHTDSALWAYGQVIDLNRRIPRIFLIQAQLQSLFLKAKAGNTDQEAIAALSKLETDWENKGFLDRIFYEKSQLLTARGQDSLAIVYAQKSLKETLEDAKRNTENYGTVARIYFENASYELAGAYYDSLSQYLSPTSVEFLRTQKKISGLKDLSRYEKQAKQTDSLLALAALSPIAQKAYVAKQLSLLQLKDSLSALEKETSVSDKGQKGLAVYSSSSQGAETTQNKDIIERPSPFYFYNSEALANGALAFEAQWGDRALIDNWRWIATPKPPKSSKSPSPISKSSKPAISKAVPPQRPARKKDWVALEASFLDGIPKSAALIDSLNNLGEQAYFQLGSLFMTHFKRPDLALPPWLQLYQKPASPALMPATIFALYELYKEVGSYEAEKMRSVLLDSYSESDYAQLLRDPEAFSKRRTLEESQYDSLYTAYINENFNEVLAQSTLLLSKLLNDPKGAPVALIQANTLGRLYGYTAYKNALKKIQSNYPNTAASEKATSILAEFENNPPEASFGPATTRDDTYIALLFSGNYNPEEDQAYQALFLKSYPRLQISREVFAPGKIFYVIRGFDNKMAIENLKESNFFKENPLPDQSIFVILGSHYKTLQLFKNLSAYQARE